MAKQKTSRLGIGELEILEMLWREGPISLSVAHERLGQPIGYTTVQTRLERMVKKGSLKKSKDRPSLYSAVISREEVNQHDLDLLVNRVNQGAFLPLVAQLVGDRSLTSEEIDQLKTMIAEAEKKGKKSKAKKKQGGRNA